MSRLWVYSTQRCRSGPGRFVSNAAFVPHGRCKPDSETHLLRHAVDHHIALTAVSVVLPWSTCPMVPMFTCGLERSKVESSAAAEAPDNRGSAGPATRVARRALLSLNDSAHFERARTDARLAASRSAMF